MFLDGIVMDCLSNGKLRRNIELKRKTKMMFLLLNLENNAETLQVSGYLFKKKNSKDWE